MGVPGNALVLEFHVDSVTVPPELVGKRFGVRGVPFTMTGQISTTRHSLGEVRATLEGAGTIFKPGEPIAPGETNFLFGVQEPLAFFEVVIPEPTSLALLATGLVAAGFRWRRQR
jgi:hypothetical protein